MIKKRRIVLLNILCFFHSRCIVMLQSANGPADFYIKKPASAGTVSRTACLNEEYTKMYRI